MGRTLRTLTAAERAEVTATIHAEAEAANWHSLSNPRKSVLYGEWACRFDLTHQAVKDGIMKGFDAAQQIPPKGEAAVHSRVRELLASSRVPYWADKVRLWGGRAQADFVLGIHRDFLTHTVELEPAPSWRDGLTQALWYKSAYFHEQHVQALPMLILFGAMRRETWDQIETTCLDQRVQLTTFDLLIDGGPAPHSFRDLLYGTTQLALA